MRFVLALTIAAAACTGDPTAPTADAAPDTAPDADPCATAGQPCGCRTGPGVTQGSLRCVGGGLVCDCVAAPDAAPDVDMDAVALDAAPEAGPDAAADAGIDAPPGDAPADAPADADAACETRCDGACVDTGFDPLNCGACGVRCTAGAPHTRAQCFGGRCEMPCEDGYQSCNSSLADGCETYVLGSDRNNCGSCRGTCAPSAICVAGRCRTP